MSRLRELAEQNEMLRICGKCSPCCKFKKKENPVEAEISKSLSLINISKSLSLLKIVEEEPPQVNLEEIEAHSKDMKNIYAYAVDVMKNYLGKPSYPYITQPKQLYPYILFLCEGLEDHEYVAIKEIISQKQLLNIQLTVVIKDAKVIHPRVTEFSRVFCKLWITKGNEQLTSVKDSTAYLCWDESFVLDILDYESDVFHVEIWASRPDPGFLEKISTFNFERFREDDPLAEEKGIYFLGDAVEYVKSLPCVGQNMLWTLKRGPKRIYIKGQLNLYIQLNTKKGLDCIVHLYCHMTIIRLCYEKQVLNKNESHKIWKNWLEIIPNAAITLIQQHAMQHGITPIEQCICSWLVTSSLKMKEEDRISFYLLGDLLEYSLSEINECEIGSMKDVMFKSISDFLMFTLDMLRDLHRHFDLLNTEMADELYDMLRCMNTAELKLSTSYMDSFKAIEEEATEWYRKVIADLKKDLETDDSIDKVSEGLKNIMKIYLRNQIVLDDIFMRAWNVRYTCLTYIKLDEVVCTTINPMIKHLMIILEDPGRKRKSSESLQMLQLYHTVRNLVTYVISCIPSQRAVIRMDEYSTWFGEEMVLEWFLLCDVYTSPFIQRAVLADAMERLNQNIVHGTSVADVTSIIDEMVIEVWMKLKWKDQFYTHGALLEATKSCVLDYSVYILDRIKLENYFCKIKEFEVSNKLCVALSNVYAISEHLRKTNKKIKKELKVAESALGFEMSQPLINMQSGVEIAAAEVFLVVFKKINRRIRKLVKKSIKNKVEPIPGSVDLCSYMDDTLEIMYTNLKKDAFDVILRHMWIVSLKRLKYGLKYSEALKCDLEATLQKK